MAKEIRIFRHNLLVNDPDEMFDIPKEMRKVEEWALRCDGQSVVFYNNRSDYGVTKILAPDGTPYEIHRDWTEPLKKK